MEKSVAIRYDFGATGMVKVHQSVSIAIYKQHNNVQ